MELLGQGSELIAQFDWVKIRVGGGANIEQGQQGHVAEVW